MLEASQLKQVIHLKGLTKTDQLLLCLAVDGCCPKQLLEVRELAVGAGVRGAKTWNIGGLLGGSRGKAINTSAGWELGNAGSERVKELIGSHLVTGPSVVALQLRNLLPRLADPETRAFVEESVACYENKLYRAAVVLSWVGAVSVLYQHVVANRLHVFNTEAQRRDAKWKVAKSPDDLSRMKEHDFLQVLETISVLGKNVKNELESCLKFRNGCGHPNSLKIGPSRVEAHVETLVLNVFAPFV